FHLLPPVFGAVRPATDPASQRGHGVNDVTDRSCWSGDRNCGAGRLSCQISPDTDDDHPMASLRNAELFGAHDEVRRTHRLLQAGLTVFDPNGPQLVLMAMAAAEGGKVLH